MPRRTICIACAFPESRAYGRSLVWRHSSRTIWLDLWGLVARLCLDLEMRIDVGSGEIRFPVDVFVVIVPCDCWHFVRPDFR